MESTDTLQTWQAFQGKLRNSGAITVYAARAVLIQEYMKQQRKEQLDALGGVHELSPSHSPIDSSSVNLSCFSLSQSPSSNELPLRQGRRPGAILQPIGIQSSKETTCSTTVGFKSFVNEVVGRTKPESDERAQLSRQHSDSFSPFEALFFIRPRTMGRSWSTGSEPVVVPLSRGTISSDRQDPFYGDHRQRCNTVDSLRVPSPHTTSEQSSLISMLSDKWTRTIRGSIDVNGKTEIKNSSIVLSRPPRAQRRLSEPFSSCSSITPTDFCAHTRSNAMPAIDSSQWALPKSKGDLLVDFPTTKRARGGPSIPPSKLLVDFPTTKKKPTVAKIRGRAPQKL